ncbi:MAG: hypothetical protein IJ437_01605 [Clostridia bacterium]|nr:hypothetical protein [Clostridia bacterium]
MLKRYIKNALISCGISAVIFFFASLFNKEIFDINFFRMLTSMLFINGSVGFVIYEFSKNKILNCVLQGSVMIFTAVTLPMAFGILDFNLPRIISTIVVIGISYPVALLIAYKIQKANLKKINEKLSNNKE